MLNELIGFVVPEWTLEKMKIQMQSMRTDGPKIQKVHKPKEAQPIQQVVHEFLLFQQKVNTFCVLCCVTKDRSNIHP